MPAASTAARSTIPLPTTRATRRWRHKAARDLIDNKAVVALAGGASLLDCAVNAATYNRNDVLDVQGVGVDPLCFNAPSIAPVNVGPYTLTTVMLDYAMKNLGAKKLCAFFLVIGGTQEAYANAVSSWEEASGNKIALIDMTLPAQGDLTPMSSRRAMRAAMRC